LIAGRRYLETKFSLSPFALSSPVRQQDQEVVDPDRAVIVEIRDTRGRAGHIARSPRTKQREKVGDPDDAVPVEVAERDRRSDAEIQRAWRSSAGFTGRRICMRSPESSGIGSGENAKRAASSARSPLDSVGRRANPSRTRVTTIAGIFPACLCQ